MRPYRLLLVAAAALAATPESAAQVSLTTTSYTQNFNTLPSSSTATATGGNLNNVNAALNGWYFLETGTSGNTTLTAGTGSGTTGDTYSFGAASNSDRSLGSLQSGSVVPSFGFYFTNNTGSTITSLSISYLGEVWRIGGTGRADRLDFSYSTDASSLGSGTWTNVDALDFSSTSAAATASGSLLQSATVTSSISSLSIANGSGFFMRWTGLDVAGADDGMGVDDFSLTATLQALTRGNYWAPTAGGGGSGTWSSSSNLWSETAAPASAGTASQALTGALVFGDAAGTVTVSGTVTHAAGLTFGTDGYALTGGTVTLSGADAAANTITANSAVGATINSALSAANGLTKAGNGTLTLGGANTLGAVAVSAGGLVLGNAAALGDAVSGTSVASGATLDLNGQALVGEAVALSGTLANGSATAASLSGLVTVSGASGVSTTGNLALSGGTAGSGSLTKSGNGTLSLVTATADHSGGTTVSAGTLALGGITHSGDVSIASGATLSGTGAVSGAVTLATGGTLSTVNAASTGLTLASLTAAGGALNLDLADTLVVTGALTLDGAVTLNLSNIGSTPAATTYNLISFGSLLGSGGITLGTSAPAGYSMVGELGSSGYVVTLSLLARNLTWTGGSGTWDTSTANWTDGSTGLAYVSGDRVTFDGSGDRTVTIDAPVTPGTLELSPTSGTLTLAGAAIGGSTGVVKGGAGTAVLSGANTFTGAVSINAGKLVAADASALGSGSVTVAAGAELTLRGVGAAFTNPITLSGGVGADAGVNTAEGTVTLAADAALSAAASSSLTLTNQVAGAGRALAVSGDGDVTLSAGASVASLSKSGNGTLTLGGASTITSGTTLSAGALNLNHATALGNGTLTINGGALGNTSGSAKTIANAVTVGGDFTLGTGADQVLNLSGNIDLGAGARAGTTTATYGGELSGNISNGSFTKAGAGTLTLSGSNTLSGLTVAAGTLRMGSAGALGGNSVTVDSGATLELNGQNASLTSLSGSGSVSNGGAANSTLTLGVASSAAVGASFSDGSGGGKLGLTKTGNGALALNAASTHTGSNTISAGSVAANVSGALGTGDVALSAGATLSAGNGTEHTNNITVGTLTTTPFSGTWNFSTAAPSSVAGGVTFGNLAQGNNNGTTTLLASTATSSGYTGSSGTNNAGAAARTGALATGANGSAYFEVTLSASANITVSSVAFGARSTASGPVNVALVQVDDGTLATLGSAVSIPNTSAWVLRSFTGSPLVAGDGSYALRIYGYGGSGSTSLGTANWRIDDLIISGATVSAGAGAGVLGVVDIDSVATFSGNITLLGAANLTAASGSDATFSGEISGAGPLAKVGDGRVVLSGTNNFTGGLTVSAGTLEAASTGALGSGLVTLSGGFLDLGGLAVSGNILLAGGGLVGTSGLTTDATLRIATDAELVLSSSGAFGAANIQVQGGTLDLNNLNPGNVITYTSGAILNKAAWTGAIASSATGDLTAQLASLASAGNGTVALGSGQSANLDGLDVDIVYRDSASVSGLSTFTGNLTVQSGTLVAPASLGVGGTLAVGAGGTIDFGGSASTQAVTYAGGVVTGSGFTGVLTVASGAPVTLQSANIAAGASVLVQSGSSATLSGPFSRNITYTGGEVGGLSNHTGLLTVDGAELTENGTIGGSVSLVDGGTLSGGATVVGNLSQSVGSILSPGNSPGIVTVLGDHILSGGARFDVEVLNVAAAVAGADYDSVSVSGLLDFAAVTVDTPYIIRLISINASSETAIAQNFDLLSGFDLTLFTFGTLDLGGRALADLVLIETNAAGQSFLSVDGVTAVDSSRFSVAVNEGSSSIVLTYTPIPEPSTYGLILGGLALAGAALRRRRKA